MMIIDKIQLGSTDLYLPRIIVGCMRMKGLDIKSAEAFIGFALEQGFNFFDHADIYGGGVCEEIFAKAIGMNGTVRDKIVIQSKCGIIPGVCYDFSKEHIIKSVEGSLKRLKTDYLDILLLHRPDALAEPQEVAEAFDILKERGMVRYFGVSNHNPMQIKLLEKYTKEKIQVNQLQLSIAHSSMIGSGIHVNMSDSAALDRDGSVLDFCRLNDITVQAWSPMQYGMMEGVFLGSEKFPELNREIDKIAEKYGVTNTAVAMAWILRHPANMQIVTGTMKTARFADIIKSTQFKLTREEWYRLYMAAGNSLP